MRIFISYYRLYLSLKPFIAILPVGIQDFFQGVKDCSFFWTVNWIKSKAASSLSLDEGGNLPCSAKLGGQEIAKFLADAISTGFEAEMGIWKQNWNFIFRIEIRYIVAVVLCQLPLKVSFGFLLHFKFGSWYTVFHIGKHRKAESLVCFWDCLLCSKNPSLISWNKQGKTKQNKVMY